MSNLLDIIGTEEYKKYSKRFKNFIGFNMSANDVCLEDKSGNLYLLNEIDFNECLNLISESVKKNKNLLINLVKNNIVEIKSDAFY